MLRFRRLVLATATLVAAAALTASPAFAYARPDPLVYTEQITSAHFQVHYTGNGADHVLHSQAADLAALAEQAFATETGWGYPAPPDDGDGHIDVYVIAQQRGVAAVAVPDNEFGLTSTGFIEVDPSFVPDPVNAPTLVDSDHVIAHELFHLVQFGIWLPSDRWFMEATAEWVGLRADNYSTVLNGVELGPPDMSIDCVQYNSACATDVLDLGGYTRWSFWEYLYEKYGDNVVKDVLNRLAAVGDPNGRVIDALGTVLAGKGTTVAAAFQGYALANLTGDYPVTALQHLAPAGFGSTTYTGLKTASLPVKRVAVNHLATRYLPIGRGDGATDGQCFAATLALTVSLPAGLDATPYFYWSANGSKAVPFSVSGNVATLRVPWDTCAWSDDPPYTSLGYLMLPNPSTTADGQIFTVSGSLTVDPKTIASANAPPASTVTGPVVDAPTGDSPPSIFLYGPEVIPVVSDRALRLVVFSSGSGRLRGAVGDVALGSRPLRAGNNDLRFTLPRSVFAKLRRSAGVRAASNVLSVTSVSPSGADGSTVTRALRLARTRHR